MVFELVVEKYKQGQREAGRQEERRRVKAWYARQQAALRAGLPFNEPPPGYSPDTPANGKDAG